MVKIVNLEQVRKEQSDDAADWGVIDALKRAIELVESGEFKADRAVVCLAGANEDGEIDRYRVLRVDSHLEALGLLVQTQHDLLESGIVSDDAE